MYIYKQRTALTHHLQELRNKKKSIGFVPTMGALHAGHLSLLHASEIKCDVSVCSIFINPRQFNNREDFEKYPKNLERDLLLLEEAGCDIVYIPDEDAVYRNYEPINFQLEHGASLYEGASRPGHFAGMAAVVKILLETVRPDIAFFGIKDYQQTLVIKWLVAAFALPVTIEVCPTLREPNGLAMSSRNERLSDKQRATSAVIYQALLHLKNQFGKKETYALVEEAKNMIMEKGFVIDYLDVVNASTLEKSMKGNSDPCIAIAAVYAGPVRLIDNLLLN